jgi:hypothetical protein
MQLDALQAEREAHRLLPEVLGELFDREEAPFSLRGERPHGLGEEFDLLGEGHGQLWLFEVKQSSSPGLVSRAAERLAETPQDALKVLVVPYMTPGGERTADSFGINWIDLSGNAHIRADQLYIYVKGKPNRFVRRGRPSSPFAPKSARIARVMLVEPLQWWRQKDLVSATDLNSGQVSRVVKRLLTDRLLEQRENELRPRAPEALLDAWEDEYRFDRHEILRGHVSGSGVELSRDLEERLTQVRGRHAFTGLAAAWALQGFARFRLNSVYVDGDPREIAEQVGMRINDRGANVQLIRPDDAGVFIGARKIEGLQCVAPVQAYLDLRHLPERADEAAGHLRDRGLWDGA